MEYKALPIEYKVNHQKREIEGYASTFNNRDRVGDIVQKGAFAKTIRDRFAGGAKKDVKVLWQHFHPIGLPIHMEEDEKGLYTVSKIANTPQGDEALALADEGVVDKMSIGYDIIKSDWEGNSQMLQELKLHEYSLVTFPANEEASLTGVKGMGLGMSIEKMHALLKDYGATNLTDLLKEGRTLSQGSRSQVEAAIEAMTTGINALQELIDISDPDEGEGKGKNQEPHNQNGEPEYYEDVKSILHSIKQYTNK